MENDLVKAILNLIGALEHAGAKPNQDFSFIMSKNLMFKIADSFKMREYETDKQIASICGVDIIEK